MHYVPCAVLALAVSSVATGGTLYVDTSCGLDSWTGQSPTCQAPDGPKATIQAAINAAVSGDEVIVAPGTYPETVDLDGKAIVLRSAGGAEVTIIHGNDIRDGVLCTSGEGPDTVVEGFTITHARDTGYAGGMLISNASPTVRDCIFSSNVGDLGGGVLAENGSHPRIEGCLFIGNEGAAGAGAIGVRQDSVPVVVDCDMVGNAGAVGAIVSASSGLVVVNCRINENVSSHLATTVTGSATWVGTAVSRNEPGSVDPGIYAVTDTVEAVHCTFTGTPATAFASVVAPLTLTNCIVWGNNGSINAASAQVTFCDVEGGFGGAGNIDADPLFVQAGTDDLRLGFGSPCIDAGSTAALPADTYDVDRDGDTSEPLPLDAAGNPRLVGGTVDMGAYEGAFEEVAPADSAEVLDPGDLAVLVPSGGTPDPLAVATATLMNVSGPENASAVLTQDEQNLHPSAGGYSEQSSILQLDSTIGDGAFAATLFIPLDPAILAGADPQLATLTRFDPQADGWAVAVATNTQNSPGMQGPIGDRVVAVNGGPFGITQDPGDWGVYWNPAAQQGFVWANVDHCGDFGVGVNTCPADCAQTPDGVVDVHDMLALLANWGPASALGPYDLDQSGDVDGLDFAQLLDSWGPCVTPVAAPSTPSNKTFALQQRIAQARMLTPSMSLDLSGNGTVGSEDYLRLFEMWGASESCADAACDLDGDGQIGHDDVAMLLAHW